MATATTTPWDELSALMEKKYLRAFIKDVQQVLASKSVNGFINDLVAGKLPYLPGALQQTVASLPLDMDYLQELTNEAFLNGAGGAAVAHNISFDFTNEYAVEEAKLHAADRVTAIKESTRKAIQQEVVDSLAYGVAPYDLAENLKQIIGLGPQQVQAVDRYRQGLTNGGMTKLKAQRLAKQYSERLLKQRSTLIARTEIQTALNRGKDALWASQVQDGLLDPQTTFRKLIVALDPKCCDECWRMRGQLAPIGGYFANGMSGPPFHPQCRCTTGLVFNPIGAAPLPIAKINSQHDELAKSEMYYQAHCGARDKNGNCSWKGGIHRSNDKALMELHEHQRAKHKTLRRGHIAGIEKDDDSGIWRTINGHHIYIAAGQNLHDAVVAHEDALKSGSPPPGCKGCKVASAIKRAKDAKKAATAPSPVKVSHVAPSTSPSKAPAAKKAASPGKKSSKAPAGRTAASPAKKAGKGKARKPYAASKATRWGKRPGQGWSYTDEAGKVHIGDEAIKVHAKESEAYGHRKFGQVGQPPGHAPAELTETSLPSRRLVKSKKSGQIRTLHHVGSEAEREAINKDRYNRGLSPIAPGWKQIYVNTDPKGDLQATGVDYKGKTQSLYSTEHTENSAAAKWHDCAVLEKKLPSKLDPQLDRDVAAGNHTACATYLMRWMGMRPDSEGDTGAEEISFGATTLQAGHVSFGTGRNSNKTRLTFQPAKKHGKTVTLESSDPILQKFMRKAIAGKKPSDRIFDTTSGKCNEYLQARIPGATVKQLRTVFATITAMDKIDEYNEHYEAPTTDKEFNQYRNEIGDYVSAALGNTRTEALKSYINPVVFKDWENGLNG